MIHGAFNLLLAILDGRKSKFGEWPLSAILLPVPVSKKVPNVCCSGGRPEQDEWTAGFGDAPTEAERLRWGRIAAVRHATF